MTEQEIKELVDSKVLKNITDYAVQTVLRRVLFNAKNKIDWQDFYKQILQQMPELRLEANIVCNFVDKILEGADIRKTVLEYVPDITQRYPEGMSDLPDSEDSDFEPV